MFEIPDVPELSAEQWLLRRCEFGPSGRFAPRSQAHMAPLSSWGRGWPARRVGAMSRHLAGLRSSPGEFIHRAASSLGFGGGDSSFCPLEAFPKRGGVAPRLLAVPGR